MGGSESVQILGVLGIIIMWQLVFASCHRLILKNKNKNKIHLKGCVMVMADPSDLGHGKKKVSSAGKIKPMTWHLGPVSPSPFLI